jgi:hypothetical protein
MTEIQNSKQTKAKTPTSDCNVLIIGICNLDIVWCLSIVIWNFSDVTGKASRFYPNQLKLTLTLLWIPQRWR